MNLCLLSVEEFNAFPPSGMRKREIGLSIRALKLLPDKTYALVSTSGRGKSVLLSTLAGYFPSAWRKNTTWREFQFVGKKVPFPLRKVKLPAPVYSIKNNTSLIYLPQSFPNDRTEVISTLEAMMFILCAKDRSMSFAKAKQTIIATVSNSSYNLDPEILHQPIHQLSGGERRRVELLTRLEAISSHGPNSNALVLLDEPTTGLDVLNEIRFIEFLTALKKIANAKGIRLTFVVATHAFSQLSKETIHFDEVLVLDRDDPPQGGNETSIIRLVFQGSIANVFDHFNKIRTQNNKDCEWSDIINILQTTSSKVLEDLFYGEKI